MTYPEVKVAILIVHDSIEQQRGTLCIQTGAMSSLLHGHTLHLRKKGLVAVVCKLFFSSEIL